jgi:hypothetical protein
MAQSLSHARSLDDASIDAERLGKIILGECQGPSFSADSPADMLIDRRHWAGGPDAIVICALIIR